MDRCGGLKDVSHHDIRAQQTTRDGPVPRDPQGLQREMAAARQNPPGKNPLSEASINDVHSQPLPNNRPPSPPQPGRSRAPSASPAPHSISTQQAQHSVQTQPPPPGPQYRDAQDLLDKSAYTPEKQTIRERALSANKQPPSQEKTQQKEKAPDKGHER